MNRYKAFAAKQAFGMITELGTVGILAYVLINGPPSIGMVVAAVLGGAVTQRVNSRSKQGTGVGSIRPSEELEGAERVPRLETPRTGFTDAPEYREHEYDLPELPPRKRRNRE